MAWRGIAWLAVWLACAAALGDGDSVPPIIQKLRGEAVGSLLLENAGPRQVAELVHERLQAHAVREGYRLVWDVPGPLPAEPRVLFGMENGSLALLMEAAAALADLRVEGDGERLVVRSLASLSGELETRRYPVRDEFWESIGGRSPEDFFGELGIQFPTGTSMQREGDGLVVTHEPQKQALVLEVLKAVYAYPYHWQLQVSVADAEGNAMSPSRALVLDPVSRSSVRFELAGGGDVDIDCELMSSSATRQFMVARLKLRMVTADGSEVREETVLSSFHSSRGDIRLAGVRLRFDTEFRFADNKELSYLPHSQSRSTEPQGGDWTAFRTTAGPFEVSGEPLPLVLKRVADESRQRSADGRGFPLAYALTPRGVNTRCTVACDAPLGLPLQYVAMGNELELGVGRNGVLVAGPQLSLSHRFRHVYGPAVLPNASLLSLVPDDRDGEGRAPVGVGADHLGVGGADKGRGPASATRRGSVRAMERWFGGLGVAFPHGTGIWNTMYAGESVAVIVNTPEAFRTIDRLLLEHCWQQQRRLGLDVRLVRAPGLRSGVVPGELRESRREVDESSAVADWLATNGHVVWSLGLTLSSHHPGIIELAQEASGPPIARVEAQAAAHPLLPSPLSLTVRARAQGGEGVWSSSLYVPDRRWIAFRADALGSDVADGTPCYILVRSSEDWLWPWVAYGPDFWRSLGKTEPIAALHRAEDWESTRRKSSLDTERAVLSLYGLVETRGEPLAADPGDLVDMALEDPAAPVSHSGDNTSSSMRGQQWRLYLSSNPDAERAVEGVVAGDGEGVLPIPDGRGTLKFRVERLVHGERGVLHWRLDRGRARKDTMAVGEWTRLRRGLWARLDVVTAWDLTPVSAPFAAAVEQENRWSAELQAEHRRVMARYAKTRIHALFLEQAPLPVALARLGDGLRVASPLEVGSVQLTQPSFLAFAEQDAEPSPQPERDSGGDDDDDDDDDWEPRRPQAVAYRLPVPAGRATLDLRDVTVAEALTRLEEAYGTPLYLREKEGVLLVRAAPFAHVARYGVAKTRLRKVDGQAAFQTWLRKRGVAFGDGDCSVYFRALDTVVARGSEDFVRQVGAALGALGPE